MAESHKKIPWWEPQVGSDLERKLLGEALDRHFANEGPLAVRFEQEIARLVGAKHAVSATSGTMAIFLALKALGVGVGDEVIVPDATFIATANAVTLTGATPVLVDIEPETLNISIDAVREAVTPRTKVIVPVHVTGRGAHMEAILEIAEQYGLKVIEDAAEGLMSKYRGKYLGTWGDAGCFSFSAAKTVTTGQGGIIVTNSDELYAALKPLKDQGRPARGTGGDDLHDTIGYNLKFTDLQAALGLGQLAIIGERLARMRRIYDLYHEGLKDIPGFTLFDVDKTNGEGGVQQWSDALVERRDELDAYLRGFNIDCRRYWLPIHRQKAYLSQDSKFPNSVRYMPKALWLPSAFTLTDEDVRTVVLRIREFYGD